jgi:hypothetical protein
LAVTPAGATTGCRNTGQGELVGNGSAGLVTGLLEFVDKGQHLGIELLGHELLGLYAGL